MRLKDLLSSSIDWSATVNIVEGNTLRLDFPNEAVCDETINMFMCSIVLKAQSMECDRLSVYAGDRLCIDCDLDLGVMLILKALERSWNLPAYYPPRELAYTRELPREEDTDS